jgi:prevent-host-death family protein
MTSVEAQNYFGLLLDTAQREPVSITRRGRPIAYLLSSHDYEALNQDKRTSSVSTALELLSAFRGSGKGGGASRLVAERETERLSEP